MTRGPLAGQRRRWSYRPFGRGRGGSSARKNRAVRRAIRLEPLEPRCLLALEVPPGFLVDQPLAETGAIDTAGEIDAYSLALTGGQTATVLVEPADSLAPVVELRGPDDALLGSSSAGPGDPVMLPTIGLDVTGVYRVLVSGGGTLGMYAVEVLQGAAAEVEPITQTPNDTLDSAEDLTSSFIDLPAGAARGAVRGTLAGGLRDDFGYSAIAVPHEFEDISQTGNVLLGDPGPSAARLDGTALGEFTFEFYGRTYSTMYVHVDGLITFGLPHDDPANGDLTAAPAAPSVAVLWDDLDIGIGLETGEVLWELRGSGDEQRLIIQWNAIQYFPFLSIFGDEDTITFQAILSADGSIQFNYRDLSEVEDPFASEGRSASVGIKDGGTQGGSRLLLAHDSAPNDFVGSRRSVRIGTDLGGGPPETFDLYRFTIEAGRAVTLALGATLEGVVLELLDASGTRLAMGTAADNVVSALGDFIVPGVASEAETLWARVAPPPDTTRPIDYTLMVLTDGVFDAEPNRSPGLAQPGTTALGAISSRDRGEVVFLGDFPAIDFEGTDCFCEPPDTHAAVGPGHIVEVVNTAIAMFNKDGSVAMAARELKDFFDPSLVAGDLFDFDPVVAYDDLAQRWIVAVLIGATAGAAETDLLYAVSNTADPTEGFAEQHRIDFGTISPGLFADFPKVGFNADAHVFTVNMFSSDVFGGGFADVNIAAIDKSTVLDADARTFSHFISERPGSSFTMAAAGMHTAEPGDPMWFVEEADFGGGNRIRVVQMEDVLSSAPIYTDYNVPVAPFQLPPGAIQPGGTFRTNDSRISNADFRNGRLVAAHAVGIAGEATVRWYEFDVSGDAPTLAQEGNIDPGPGVHAYFPSIAINAAGDLGVTYLQSSATEFVSMYVTGQVAGSTPGTMAAGEVVRQGEKTYAGSRGGDYSGIGVDPVSDTFWAANEVILSGAADPLWSTWIAEFTVADVADEDWYRVPVEAGDELRLETFTPPSSSNAGTGLLDPTIALYTPDDRLIATGDNGAADGRNALIALTATESGIYRVQVQGRNETRGDYVLQISGATAATGPPSVHDINPDNGVSLGTFPTTLRVVFSEATLSTSVEPTDLTVGGLPALTVTQLDGRTFEFQLDRTADAGDGLYEVHIAAGAVVDLQGAASVAYEAAFELDQTGPRLIETRWNGELLPADRRLASEPLIFEAMLDEPLFVLASARTGLKRPGSDDVFVINRTTGEVIHPRHVSIDVVDSTFLAAFETLPEGDYTLTLLSGEDAFEDAVGNPLDGEPLGEGVDSTPSGDGMPGGDYAIDFRVDRDEVPVGELERIEPEGSLIYSGLATGLLSPAGDEDAVVVGVAVGQTVAVVVTPNSPAATLTLQLDGADPISASSPGAAVLLPARGVANPALLRVHISSDKPTEYEAQVYVDAVVETANADSSPEQPLPLDLSQLEIAGVGGERFAAVGMSTPQTEETLVLSQTFERGLGGFTIDNGHGDGGGLWRLSGGRREDGDPSHSPPRSLYFGRGETAFLGGNYETGEVAEGAVLSPEIELPEGSHVTLSFHHFLATEDLPGFDVAEVAVITPSSETILLSSEAETLPTSTADRWERVSADITPFAGQSVQLRFRFDTGDEMANEFEGWFIDDVTISATVVTEPDVDDYALDLAGVGGRLDIVLAGREQVDFSSATLQVVSADGTQVLAAAMADPLGGREANHDLAIRGFDVPAEGDVRIRVESGLSAGYTLLIGRSLLLEGEPNHAELGPDAFRLLDGGSVVLGFVKASDTPLEFVLESDPNAFVDISTVGSRLNLSDDGARRLISHVGNEFFPAGPLVISNNGVVLAGAEGHVPYINERLPYPGFQTALAPFWDDLSDFNGTLYVHRMLVDGVDAFIIQWDDRPHFSSEGTVTFQVQILAGGRTPIRYAYRDVDFGLAGLDGGVSATIGYQRDAATGLEFSFEKKSAAAGDVIYLRRTDPSDNFRLDVAAGEVRTLSLRTPTGRAGGENDLIARLEVVDAAGTVIASGRGVAHARPAVVSFVAPAEGAYTVRVVPESGSGEYVLDVSDQPIPGDFDLDGNVDGRDLLTLLLHFGIESGAEAFEGDADGDGDVDRQDIDVWREHLGLGVRAAPPAADSAREAALRRSKAASTREEAFATSDDWLQSNLLRAVGRRGKELLADDNRARRVL